MTIAESWLQEGIAKGKAEGLEEGIRASKLEDARKMLTRGCEWAFITDITGIVPEDIA
jgi:predicted transposase/invertase (TIGR01784 family)